MYDAYYHCIMLPKQDFHDQLDNNEDDRRIKSAMAPPQMSDTAARIAAVLGKEKPSPQPVLRGLIEETTLKTYERRIKSLEDKIAATTSKKVKGDGTRLKSALRGPGTSIAATTNAPKSTKAKSNAKKSSSAKGRGAKSNGTASDKKKSNDNGRKVSFAGKKANKRTNSRK